MRKLKVGDIVTIKCIEPGTLAGRGGHRYYFTEEMVKYCNHSYKIMRIGDLRGDYDWCQLEGNSNFWHKSWFKEYEERPKIVTQIFADEIKKILSN